MSEVGITLKMTENVSSVAPKVSSALRGISDSGEDLKAALDLGDLEQKYQKFAERVDKIHDTQTRNNKLVSTQTGTPNIKSDSQQPSAVGTATSLIRSGGRTVTSLGSGDIGGAANDVLGTMAGLAKAAGPVGAVIAAAGAVAFAGNALSKQYEKHMSQVMDLNNVLGRFGKTSLETGENFRTTMNEVSEASARYGYTLTEGMNVYNQLIKKAGTTTQEEAKDVMYFQRFGGFDAGNLTQFRGTGSRFGMGGQELLGNALGTMKDSGMEKGLFSEFMSSTLSIFEDGISRGVVRGFDEINELQSRIGGMGEQFQGQYGMNLLKTLDSRSASATGLQSQGDLIMFNAAREMMKEDGVATDYISVQKTLEKGMTQDLLQSVYNQVKTRAGGSGPDMIELIKEIIPGLTYTTAEILLKELAEGEKTESSYSVPGYNVRGTDELTLLGVEETISNSIRNAGKVAMKPKARMIAKTAPIIGKFNDMAEASAEKAQGRDEFAKWKEWEENSNFEKNMIQAGTQGTMGNAFRFIGPEIKSIMAKQNQYPEELVEDTKQFGYGMSNLPEDALSFLTSSKFLDQIVDKGRETLSEGETKEGRFTQYDMGLAIELLIEAIGKFNESVAEEKQVNITNLFGEE